MSRKGPRRRAAPRIRPGTFSTVRSGKYSAGSYTVALLGSQGALPSRDTEKEDRAANATAIH